MNSGTLAFGWRFNRYFRTESLAYDYRNETFHRNMHIGYCRWCTDLYKLIGGHFISVLEAYILAGLANGFRMSDKLSRQRTSPPGTQMAWPVWFDTRSFYSCLWIMIYFTGRTAICESRYLERLIEIFICFCDFNPFKLIGMMSYSTALGYGILNNGQKDRFIISASSMYLIRHFSF